MILRTCLHCRHREGCPIKADILARTCAAGLKLATATFRCPERWRGIEIGRVVEVRLIEGWEQSHDGETDRPRWGAAIVGTIVDHLRDGRLAIWLDRPTSQNHIRIRLNPDYPGLLLTDEARQVCECGRPEGAAMFPDPTWCCDICCEPVPDEGQG